MPCYRIGNFALKTCDSLRKAHMVMVKLQVLLVPHNRKEVDSTKLTQWGTRKFVHLAEGSSTLHQVCETLVMRYRKLYPDDDELQIFLVQDNDMCDLDPDYLVDEVLNQGDIIRVIASNSARPNMLDRTLTDISHRAQSTPTAVGYPRKATAESSRMDIDPQTTQDDLLSRPTIWNERISSNSSSHDIHIPKKRTSTTQQKINNEFLTPSASSPTAARLSSTSHLDQSMISLPPPESRDDRTIPRKRSNPVSHSELPTKRITSGMLSAPVHESKSPENETHTMLASPLEHVPQPSPTKLVDMNSFVKPDIDMEEGSAADNKKDSESSDDGESDAGSVMSKQELLDMFKDLYSKTEAEETKKNDLKSVSKISLPKGRPARNLMKGLEIDMVNAHYPVADHSTRATRSRLRGQNGTSENGAPIVYTTERTLMSPVRTNDGDSSNNTVPTVNIVQNGKDTTKTTDETNNNSNESSRISLEFPPKSKLASVFDKVKKFDAKLTSLNLPRNHDTSFSETKSEPVQQKKEESKPAQPEDASKDLMSEQISESSSDESSESSDESDSSTSGNKSKPRLAASTPSSSFTSLKARGQALSTKARNTILGPSETKAAEKKDTPEQKPQKANLSTTAPASIKKPTLNSLTDLARRGVPDVRDSSQQLTAPAKTQNSQTQDESSELSSESSSSSSDDSDSDGDSSKYITAKKLADNNKKKKRGNGGFAALMKDARK